MNITPEQFSDFREKVTDLMEYSELTQWEASFIDDIDTKMDMYQEDIILSENQIEKIEEIYKKYFP